MAVAGRMRIAMFAHNYLPHPGGVEVVVWNLARGLAERHDVVLVSSAYDGANGVSREDGMEVHRLPAVHFTERRGVPYPTPFGPGVLQALAAVRNVDVVHAHGALYAQTLLARHAARRARAPLVLTEHVGLVEYRRAAFNGAQKIAWRLIGDGTVRQCALVATCSARVQRWLEQRSGRQVRYVGHGVDLVRFHRRSPEERRALRRSFGLPENGVTGLFVGRDADKKNIGAVLDAPRDGYVLVVCGAERNLQAANLVDLGIVPYERMPDLFGCMDFMVHAASGEGFPLAVQEAIASGVPVALLWDEGYERWMPREVVAACDRLQDVASEMVQLAGDSMRRDVLARAGRDWASRHWSWAATVAAYEQIYEDSLSLPADGRDP
jgi:D-inositol-3-phosphate glycosyltransferase